MKNMQREEDDYSPTDTDVANLDTELTDLEIRLASQEIFECYGGYEGDYGEDLELTEDVITTSGSNSNDASCPLKTSESISLPDDDELDRDRDPDRGTETHPFVLLSCAEIVVHRLVHGVSRLSRQWFTHLFLFAILAAYAAAGGLLFWYIEGNHELRNRKEIETTRADIQRLLWNVSLDAINETEWMERSLAHLYKLERLAKRFHHAYDPENPTPVWTYWGAVFYSGTVFTSIGYGHIVPSTTAGRAFTIVYAVFGIPLLLTVLADFGKLFTRGIKCLIVGSRRFYHTRSCRRVRTKPVEALRKVVLTSYEVAPKGEGKPLEESTKEFDRPNATYVVDDEFNLPVPAALLLLIAYIMFGAFIFRQWEKDWTFFEAFYFVFISMSTIGFGDFVPEHPNFMMATFVYLLFGLALTSMCINIVQENLSSTFKKASTKLGERMGIKIAAKEIQDASFVEIAPVHKPNQKEKKGE